MQLTEKLISSFLAFELDIDINSSVHGIRKKAIKKFEELGFPNRKLESWKYTSLNQIIKEDYTIFSKKKMFLILKKLKIILLTILNHIKLYLLMVFLILFCLKLVTKEWIFV